MPLKPQSLDVYHIFLASPGDVNAERQHVRQFFDDYNRSTAHLWRAEFKVIDWENSTTIGVGRPQELITQQTLEKFKDSLALVVGLMAQRFGSPSGEAESGTEEEFRWSKQTHDATGFPEIKWFFRKIEKLELPADPDAADNALDQWKKVRDFRQRMQDLHDPIFYTEYPSSRDFGRVFDHDLNLWLNDPARPWASKIAESGRTSIVRMLPAEFDTERYRAAVTQRFDKVNFEMLDSTGAYYSGVRLWSVFVPQSARECHQYNPRLLEIPKEHQERLLKSGDISEQELANSQQHAEEMRREYFQQPFRPVLEVVDQALRESPSRSNHRLVILGDPGSGKSSLIRYLALRWSSIGDRATRDAQPIPLVIDLGDYSRWKCHGRKGFVRFLEEAPVWHDWPAGLLERLLAQPGRIVLLLDGLDEIFDLQTREEVVNDMQRFSTEHAQTPIVVTSRVVGYQAQRLRDAEFRHFMLQDLDPTQVSGFIDRWHEQTFDDTAQAAPKPERLKKAIRDSKSIAMLAGNPLLLTMMAILNRNQELPRDRVDLYAQATRLLLYQWDTERALADFPGLSGDIGWREKHDLLRHIASFMQASPSGLNGNMIAGSTLTGLIEDYLHTALHFAQSRAAARAVVDHLRQRNFILCFVGADSYGFVHRTFLEYYCAADFVHQFHITKSLDEAGLLDLFDQHCCDDEWREVLRLICSQIDDQFVGQIVDRLATRTDLDKWDRQAPIVELSLAVYCLSEARNLAKITDSGRRLMQRTIGMVTRSNLSYDLHMNFVNALLPACRELGDRWPGHDELNRVAVSQLDLIASYVGISCWPTLVAWITNDRQCTVELCITSRGIFSPVYRSSALQVLAEKWPDESTRELLRARAVQDEDTNNRITALRVLGEKWPDESTREMLRIRVVEDQDESVRGAAYSILAGMHSEFGGIVGNTMRYGLYSDPWKPVSAERIEKAAEKAGIASEDLEAQIAALNQHLGWDIRVGARPAYPTPPHKKRRRGQK